ERIGRMIRSAKTNASTPPKEIPPFQSTAASGTLPIEQTKLSIETSGPTSGPQTFANVEWPSKKSDCHQLSGTHAASAPAISSGPPTNSPSVNSQPRISAIRTPSSTTRFVDAISNAIAAVKSAPLRKSERASATAAYEHDDDAVPRAVAVASDRGESSGSS